MFSTILEVAGVGSFTLDEQYHDYSERKGENDSVDLPVRAYANDDIMVGPADAEAALMAGVIGVLPATWRGLTLKSVSLQERQGDYSWLLRASYGAEEKSKSKQPRYDRAIENWDFGGQGQIITEALGTVAKYNLYSDQVDYAPETYNLIGWDGKQLNGVKRDYAVCNVTYRFLRRGSQMTAAYKAAIYGLYNTVNNAQFKDFPAKVLRFLGGSLREREDGDYDITFAFNAEKTYSFPNMGLIQGTVVVPPHHYLDVTYKQIASPHGKTGDRRMVVPVAEYAYIRKVYEEADFSLLQIP